MKDALLLLDVLILRELPVTTGRWTGGHSAAELAVELLDSRSRSAVGTIEHRLRHIERVFGRLKKRRENGVSLYGLTGAQRRRVEKLQ